MTMYLLTEQEHAQIVDALRLPAATKNIHDLAMHDGTLVMLTKMNPVEPVGYWDRLDGGDFTYSIAELCGGPTDGLLPLYAKEQQ